MEQRLLSFISTSCSASSSSDKAEVISKILENLSDFTLQMDPDRPTQFLLPFLVSPMLQLLESMFVSSTTGSCLQRGNTNKNNDSLPLKFPKKLYRRIVESRQIYSVKRELFFFYWLFRLLGLYDEIEEIYLVRRSRRYGFCRGYKLYWPSKWCWISSRFELTSIWYEAFFGDFFDYSIWRIPFDPLYDG